MILLESAHPLPLPQGKDPSFQNEAHLKEAHKLALNLKGRGWDLLLGGLFNVHFLYGLLHDYENYIIFFKY